MKNKKIIELINAGTSIYAFDLECISNIKDDALTTVILKVRHTGNKDLVFIGQSTCNESDSFDANTGYKIARKRAENNLLGWVKTEMMKSATQLGNAFTQVQQELFHNKRALIGEDAFNEWVKTQIHCGHDSSCNCQDSDV